MIGAVNQVTAGPVARFGRLELTVAFSAMRGTKYYDIRTDSIHDGVDLEATFRSPTGTYWYIPGYYDGAAWRIRFAPDEVGSWTYTVRAEDRSGITWKDGAFTCSSSSNHGWVRADGSWLRHVDGTAFCPVPHNTGWQPVVEQPALASLAASAPAGSAPRLLSFWLSQPWSATANRHVIDRLDAGAWTYDQTTCAYIDTVVANAEAAGVYLLPSIWAHDQLRDANIPAWGNSHWTDQPYSTLCSASDFFKTTSSGSDTEQWIRQKLLYRYLIARWGCSPAIAGWVGMVELNGTTGYVQNQSQALAWAASVDDWFVSNDPYRSHNGSVPIAFSISDESGTPLLDPGNLLSMRAFDSYASKVEDVDIAERIADSCQWLAQAGKPVLVTEFGGNTTAVPTAATQPLHLHNGIWASLVGGAAMPAMQWCDAASYPMLTPTMSAHLDHLAAFIGPQTWLAERDQMLDAVDTGARSSDLRGWCRSTPQRGLLWLQRYAGSTAITGATVTMTAASGTYAVWHFDTWTGAETIAGNVTVDGTFALPLTVPATSNPDIAISWQRFPNSVGDLTATVPAGERHLFTLSAGAPVTRITSKPAHGRLYQTDDGVTLGAEISSVPAIVSDRLGRVIYVAPALLGADPFGFAATDSRLSTLATATITVTNPPPGSSIIPVENVPGSGGCGAGGFAGLSLLALFALFGVRRSNRPERQPL